MTEAHLHLQHQLHLHCQFPVRCPYPLFRPFGHLRGNAKGHSSGTLGCSSSPLRHGIGSKYLSRLETDRTSEPRFEGWKLRQSGGMFAGGPGERYSRLGGTTCSGRVYMAIRKKANVVVEDERGGGIRNCVCSALWQQCSSAKSVSARLSQSEIRDLGVAGCSKSVWCVVLAR